MAIKLVTNYSKRLGLPGYSSHQFSVSVESELSKGDDVAGEAARLYQVLQQNVDEQIQHTGFVPNEVYGMTESAHAPPQNVTRMTPPAQRGASQNASPGQWRCSEKQHALILKLSEEKAIPHEDIEALAQERFGKAPAQLNKIEASGLIDELFERASAKGGARQPSYQNRRTSR